jgi:hypothetical protein
MEKLGGGPQIGQLVCFGSGQELFFSGAVHLSNLLSQHERLSYMTFHECVRVVRLQFKRGYGEVTLSGFSDSKTLTVRRVLLVYSFSSVEA